MNSSNFVDTAPQDVQESKDPDKVLAWINSLPLNEHTGKALLYEWSVRNHVTLNATHYQRITSPIGDLLRDNLRKLPRP